MSNLNLNLIHSVPNKTFFTSIGEKKILVIVQKINATFYTKRELKSIINENEEFKTLHQFVIITEEGSLTLLNKEYRTLYIESYNADFTKVNLSLDCIFAIGDYLKTPFNINDELVSFKESTVIINNSAPDIFINLYYDKIDNIHIKVILEEKQLNPEKNKDNEVIKCSLAEEDYEIECYQECGYQKGFYIFNIKDANPSPNKNLICLLKEGYPFGYEIIMYESGTGWTSTCSTAALIIACRASELCNVENFVLHFQDPLDRAKRIYNLKVQYLLDGLGNLFIDLVKYIEPERKKLMF